LNGKNNVNEGKKGGWVKYVAGCQLRVLRLWIKVRR